MLSLHFAASLVLFSAAPAHPETSKDHDILLPDAIQWQDGPASLPKGSKMAMIEGDPGKDGTFVLRVKLPDGFRIMPHTHPKDERVTVLQGTLYLGMGATFDEKAGQAMPAGSYGRTNAGINSSFTVRKISFGEGVERVFPLYAPVVDKIEVVRRGKVRRAKLYYLRDRRGRAARIAEEGMGGGDGVAATAAEAEKANG